MVETGERVAQAPREACAGSVRGVCHRRRTKHDPGHGNPHGKRHGAFQTGSKALQHESSPQTKQKLEKTNSINLDHTEMIKSIQSRCVESAASLRARNAARQH